MTKQAITYFFLIMALQLAAPLCADAQVFFDKTYDYDSTGDFGFDVFVQPDSSYFVVGGASNILTGQNQAMWMVIKKDLSQAIQKHDIHSDSVSFYEGLSGAVKKLPNGGYIIPIIGQKYKDLDDTYTWIGLVKLNANLDTVFTRMYTDTSLYFESQNDCVVMSNGDYLLGATRQRYTDTVTGWRQCLIVCTDSNGNKKWEHTYSRDSTHRTFIYNIHTIGTNEILVGASNVTLVTLPVWGTLNYNAPWFLVLDTTGNLIKDTLYGNYYAEGGAIYSDVNGGYFHFGGVDSVFNYSSVSQNRDFPFYFAKLDTNFRMEWKTIFTFEPLQNHREPWIARQLHDGNYLVVGDAFFDSLTHPTGWACKISQTGTILWEHYYGQNPDSISYYLRDAYEKPDGSIVMTGSVFGNGPAQDVWLLGVDSNGCETPGCAPLAVNNELVIMNSVKVWPNPFDGNLSFSINGAGIDKTLPAEVKIFNMLGQCVLNAVCNSAQGTINTSALPKGMYFVRVNDAYTEKVVKE